jgi:hypothetical protein
MTRTTVAMREFATAEKSGSGCQYRFDANMSRHWDHCDWIAVIRRVGREREGGRMDGRTDRFISPFELTVVERGIVKEWVMDRGWAGRD